MVRDSGKHPPHSPEALFSATQAPTPSSRLFWAGLLTQRPLLLLGSLWLVMICASAVAGHRLLFADPGQDTQAHRSQSLAPSASNVPDSEPTGGEADASPRHSAKVTLWGLSSLVGLCALGSVIISHRAKVAARQRPKQRVRRVKPKPKAKAKAPTGPKRLQPYSPDRDAVIVKGAQAVADTTPLTTAEAAIPGVIDQESDADFLVEAVGSLPSPPIAPTVTQPPHPAALPNPVPNPSSHAAAAEETIPQAEVVPQDETHPLDWEEDSLAHALDLRQRRSLSSLM